MPSNPSATWLSKLYKTKQAREFIARAYRTAFSGEHGAAVLLDLQKACYQIDTTSARSSGGAIDPYQMAINEGRRQAYLHISGILSITGLDLKPKGTIDHDHRDERRGPDERDSYVPRYSAGHDPTLDGPITGDTGSSDTGDTGDTGSGSDTE